MVRYVSCAPERYCQQATFSELKTQIAEDKPKRSFSVFVIPSFLNSLVGYFSHSLNILRSVL